MTAEEALTHFLSSALQKRWRDRYLDLVQSKPGRKKFLNDLPHAFEDRLDLAKSVENLPEHAWSVPAYSFGQPDGFGVEESSVRAALWSVGDSSLVIDTNGNFGIHQPEDGIGTKYFRV